MFDNYLDVVFSDFSIQDCMDAIASEAVAEAGWNKYIYLIGADAPESDYWNEGTNVQDQWDYSELSKHCETLMKVKMENLSIDELQVALQAGEGVMDYADEDTKNVYATWQLQLKLMANLSEKKESRSVKI